MAGSVIGALRVVLGLDAADFDAGVTRAEAGTNRLGGALTRLDRPMASTGRGMTRMGGGFQNASFQLQDLVVQIQSGTSASIALSQQVPQLLGGFGAFGAALGLATGLSIPFLARIVDMETVLDAAGASLGRLVAVMPSLGDAGGALTSVLAAIAGNLDRIAIYGATAAALFAGKYVAGLVAAAVATGSLSGALLVLRGALIRTGFGALVVGAGEIVYQFTRLVQGAGGFGNALSLLGDVAAEVWGRMGLGMDYVAAMAADAAARVKSAFLDAMVSVASGFIEMTRTVADSLNALVPFADPFSGLGYGVLGMGGTAPSRYSGLAGAAAAAQDATVGLGAAAEDLKGQINAPLQSVQALRDAMANATSSAIDLSGALGGDGKGGSGGGSGGRGGAAGAAGRAAAAADAVADAVKNITDAMDPATREAVAFNAALHEAGMTAEEMGEQKAQTLISGIDGIATAWGDFVANGFRDFKGFARSVLDSFKGLLAQMIATAAKNRIMLSLGLGGGGGIAGTAASAMGVPGMGGSVGAGIGAALGTIGSGLWAGASGVVGGFMSGGLAGAGSALSTALGSATAGLGGLATAIGAVAVPVAAAIGLFSAFRSKTKVLDEGLRVTVDGLDDAVESFRKIRKSRLFGLVSSRRTSYIDAPDEISRPIEAAIDQTRGTVMGLARTLGVGAEAFEDFSYRVQLSTKDMSEEEALRALQEELGKLSDAMAEQAGVTGDLVRQGETATQALQRLATALGTANGALRVLGLATFEASISGAGLAARMIEAAGGMDAFATGARAYFDNFLSLPEQVKFLGRQFADAMDDLDIGKGVPQSIEQFRAIVDYLMETGRTSKAGGLLALADDFKALLDLRAELAQAGEAGPVAEANPNMARLWRELWTVQGRVNRLRRAELEGLTRAERVLQKRIWRIEDEKKAQERAEAKAKAIEDERDGLLRRLYDVTDNTAALRAMELKALDPANRALQRMIWGLEDAKKAMDALDPQDFASRFAFDRAMGRAANRTTAPGSNVVGLPPVPAPTPAQTPEAKATRALRDEVAALRRELAAANLKNGANLAEVARILRKADDGAGLPVEIVA